MAAPGTGEQAEGEGQSEPVSREEVGRGWLDERTRAFWFNETVDNDDGNDCKERFSVSGRMNGEVFD